MKYSALISSALLFLSSQAIYAADGAKIYNSSCASCHATGAAGAPKVGDVAAWSPRINKGMDSLLSNAIKGIPGTAMMPKGLCSSCSDDDLQSAIAYMIENSQ